MQASLIQRHVDFLAVERTMNEHRRNVMVARINLHMQNITTAFENEKAERILRQLDAGIAATGDETEKAHKISIEIGFQRNRESYERRIARRRKTLAEMEERARATQRRWDKLRNPEVLPDWLGSDQ